MKLFSDLSLGSVALLLCCALAILPLTGCPKFADDVRLVADIAAILVPVLMPISAPVAGIVNVVSVSLKDAAKAYDDYEKAEAGLKGQKAAELRAALSAIQGNLSTLLNDLRVPSEYTAEVNRYVAIANTVVLLILSRLPGATLATAKAQTRGLPYINGDLKKAWNQVASPAHQLQ